MTAAPLADRSTASLPALTAWITQAALDHPAGLDRVVALRLGCSVRTARHWLARLAALGWLQRSGTSRRPHWRPGVLRQVTHRYPIDGLQEDRPWTRDFAPAFDLRPNVARLAQHAFMELLNNAIEHSGGSCVAVSMRQTALHLQLLVSDDGVGLFQRIEQAHGIDDAAMAMVELAKGRLTSQPDRHAGRGLFYAARLGDMLDLHANQQGFRHASAAGWQPARAAADRGTAVFVGLALDTPRTLDEVLRSASLDGRGYGLERTRVPLRLLCSPGTALDSRAQARRIASRLSGFGHAELDFTGVDALGHSFADELFRVLPAQQPGWSAQVCNAAAPVTRMIDAMLTPPGRP
jgi:anti-sigma regulatory factor (Ser/Thr protein kinase)